MPNQTRLITMRIRLIASAAALLAIVGCSAGRVPQEAQDRPVAPTSSAQPEYRLGQGDIVVVNVWKNPDLQVRVPVRPDGYISVPLVGDVLAGGKTPGEVAQETETKLTRFIRTPQVSVIVEELNSAEFQNRVRVVGGVAQPTSIAHRAGMTVIDLVLEAGGVTDFANTARARLIRQVDGLPRTYDIFLDDILTGDDISTNYLLAPGDVITVPERRF